jgi:heavy metal translocating P-type ATPase
MARVPVLLLFVAAGIAAGLAARAFDAALAARIAWTVAALPVAGIIARDSVRALVGGTLGVDLVALVAIAAALALNEPLTAAVIALMVAGGGALEKFAEARARRALTALLSRAPRIAHRRDGDALVDIDVADIRPGDTLVIKAGELVPVDGAIDGPAELDESALTGEPLPVARAAGDPARSGVLNAGAPFALVASATAEGSTYAAIVRLVHQAEAERPPMVRLADRFSLFFLPFTLAAAGGAWWLAGSAERALAVLVVATPCPLILAAPVALVCGVSRAARHGVVVKGGGALERLARVRTALFDKTGTLTTGTPEITGVEPLPGFTTDQVLSAAASLEQVSHHVVAQAIVATARTAGLPLTLPSDVTEIPGGGLRGTVDGQSVICGSAAMLTGAGIALPVSGAAARLATAAASVSWIAIGGQAAGALLLADRIRPETPRAIRALRAAGVSRLVMVTGDRAASADAVGSVLGLDAVHADLTPEGKIDIVRAEHDAAPTLMIGDGINDAPALAAADIGIAMGARGAAAAAEAADAVLLVDRIDRIADAVGAARHARAIALQSIGIGMGLSVAAMGVAALGYLPPIAGALLQEVIDIAVILNALRALAGGPRLAPLPQSAGVPGVLADHARMRDLLHHMRRTADALHDGITIDEADLRDIGETLRTLLLPHQRDEEEKTFPELARRLGGRDPLGPMARMHAEIAELIARFSSLVAGLDGGVISSAELHEARRLLYVMEAVIALHLATEEELLAQVEDVSVPNG